MTSTSVATPSGERTIGSLKVGDQVTAYDLSIGKSSTQTVQHVWINHDHDLANVTLRPEQTKIASAVASAAAGAKRYHDALVAAHGAHAPPAGQGNTADTTASSGAAATDETVDTTLNHPWLTADRGWETVAHLHVGEHVKEANGGTATVEAITTVPGTASMYDLTVSNVHTFAVGAGQFVVHNISCLRPYRKNGSRPGHLGGHHIFAGSAFKGVTGYKYMEAYTISDKDLASLGAMRTHLGAGGLTSIQRSLFDTLAQNVAADTAVNSMQEQTKIAVEALLQANIAPSDARSMVATPRVGSNCSKQNPLALKRW